MPCLADPAARIPQRGCSDALYARKSLLTRASLESISLRRLDAVLRLKIHRGMKFGAKKTPSLISSVTCTRNGLPTTIPTFSDRLFVQTSIREFKDTYVLIIKYRFKIYIYIYFFFKCNKCIKMLMQDRRCIRQK